MSAKNFFLIIWLLFCIYSAICAPNIPNENNLHTSTIREENLASDEENIDDATTITPEMIKFQENEIDSEILRDENRSTTTTASPLVSQQNPTTSMPSFDMELMKKQLVEHFRKQVTVNTVRIIFYILNELKRRQDMKNSQQQEAMESRVVETRVQHVCGCKCDKEVNNHKDNVDEDEAEVIIIDKTVNNGGTFLPEQKNRQQVNVMNNKLKQFKNHEVKEVKEYPTCESCAIKGIEEMLYKY